MMTIAMVFFLSAGVMWLMTLIVFGAANGANFEGGIAFVLSTLIPWAVIALLYFLMTLSEVQLC